jgi:hypothetical protein
MAIAIAILIGLWFKVRKILLICSIPSAAGSRACSLASMHEPAENFGNPFPGRDRTKVEILYSIRESFPIERRGIRRKRFFFSATGAKFSA